MKKMLAIVMTFAVLFGIFSVAFAAENGAVDSIESVQEAPEGYTAIRTAEDLNNIRNDLAGKYILMNDIDLSVYENWVPIGDAENPFTGELDGNGYMIKNLSINIETSDNSVYAALFSFTENCVVSNICFKGVKINISFETDKKFKWIYAASIIASAKGETLINNCFSSGEIIVNSNCNMSVAGIASELNGKTENCISNVKINVASTNESSLSYHYIGGIIAKLNGSIEKSANTANINANYNGTKDIAMYVGGVASYFSEGSTITNAYNSGNITTKLASSSNVGGISGFTVGNISNVYCSGTISCLGKEKSDGISPEIYFWSEDSLGLGLPPTKLSELKNCYSIDSNPMGIYDEESATNVAFLKEEVFKDKTSFVGFDFENIWVMSDKLGRPVFADENPKETTTVIETTETTTEVMTTEPVTETTTEKVEISTTIPEPSTTEKEETTQPTTAPATEPETQPSTVPESTTEPATEPTAAPEETIEPSDDVSPLEDCWLIKFLKQFFNFVCEIFRDILARAV